MGTNELMGTGSERPMSEAPQPNWNTAVTTPMAAAMESRFITAACRGITTER